MIEVTPHARSREDRAGDPLDGLVNLFDLAIVLAVAFLLAALSSIKLTDLLTSKNVTVIRNPGASDQAIVIKQSDQIKVVKLTGQRVAGQGTRLGTVYRLADGRIILVPGR